ncbi:MAG: dTDP-4-dehydrorhamnose 3,5-epimerase [Endomicrobium sp.]|jgi:dTDP-4-dehydrorhamnose 3,5-epimerase|uniref:dTDP-4-dehydrorhamnose 3,5-epimerase n=1 Tax=Candidatus Endomicrobiellum cubanum TaxID=3242325 RepID=UPI00282BA123|nr:dTDP-4-dehydrorhamnose 3,5-epimerase [Endomicrobium sp.]
MSFEFQKLEIEEVVLVKPKIFGDDRGFFLETYEKSEFVKQGVDVEFNQDNHSKSKAQVLRGLHYQKPPYEQAKLVRCLEGQIYDVAVDIRKESKTFGNWVIVELSQENKHMLYIPKGFAHGFVVTSQEAQIMYKVSGQYSPEHECGIIWNDKTLNIDWKIDFEPNLSDKDKKWKELSI